MDSLISTFHIDWHLIVAQGINFIVVLLVLYFFALKPLSKLMDERGKTIAGGLDNAKKQEELLAAQKAEYDATLAQARKEASEIMNEVKKDAEAKRSDIIAKADADSKAIFEAGKKNLEAEKAKILTDAKTELVNLVVSATEKVMGEVATGKIDMKIVENSIKEISA